MVKFFWGSNNIFSVSSLYSSTLDSGGEATVYGFIGAISNTSYGVITPCETDI